MLALVQDGALEHVTAHLRGKDLRALRMTCRDLRHAEGILTQVEALCAKGLLWFDGRLDEPYLRKLRHLSKVRIVRADSIFFLDRLSGLCHLRRLVLQHPRVPMDLACLSHLTMLHALELSSAEPVWNLGQLGQTLTGLTRLNLEAETVGQGLGQLTSLRRLRVYYVEHMAEARLLSCLTRLDLGESGAFSQAETAEAVQHLQQVPTLRTLVAHDSMPMPLQLTQLATLFCDCETEGLLDVSHMPALKFLGLWLSSIPDAVLAPSATRIRFNVACEQDMKLPLLAACASLSHLEVQLGAFSLMIAAERLPAQRISISVYPGNSNVFAQVCEPQLQVQLIQQLEHYKMP